MVRVVLDTNIVVSAMLRSAGFPEAALSMAMRGIVRLCISEPVLAEYQEVLNRPKFRIDSRKVATALARIREAGVMVSPSIRVKACIDPDDNIFLECAESGEANYLVTGNTAHFPDVWKKTKVVTPREFLEIMIDTQRGK
jgi:putative PIN family toxin of toxin-antitoxin system